MLMLFLVPVTLLANKPAISLKEEIQAMDKVLFEAALTCNVAAIDEIIAEDLVLYHDEKPPGHGRDYFKRMVESLCVVDKGLRRKLFPETVEVYPLYNGAIQSGVHQFFALNPDGKEVLVSTARFVHLWRREGSKWILFNIVSYDHQYEAHMNRGKNSKKL